MVTNILNLLSGQLGYYILFIFIILLAISMIKKITKLAIITLIVVVILGGQFTYLEDIQEKYGFALNENSLTVTINNQNLDIPITLLENKVARIESADEKNTLVSLNVTGASSPIRFVVPNLAYHLAVKPALKTVGMDIQEIKPERAS